MSIQSGCQVQDNNTKIEVVLTYQRWTGIKILFEQIVME